jgi:hypothetical protein
VDLGDDVLVSGAGSVGMLDCGRSEGSVEGRRQSVVAVGSGLGDSSGLHSRCW